VEDCIIAGPEKQVRKSKEEMMKHMECKEAGELHEYIRCKIDINKNELTLQIT
jgi:hypothetical protein